MTARCSVNSYVLPNFKYPKVRVVKGEHLNVICADYMAVFY